MHQLISLGRVMPLDELAAELKRRIQARGLGPPRSFEKWAEQILVDHPECVGLVVGEGAKIAGDLELEDEGLSAHKVATVAVFGPLTVEGRLVNVEADGGPFLFVDGDLIVHQIEKGGVSLIVLGSVECRDIVFCDYNQGAFLVAGNLNARAVISCDQDIHVGGEISGVLVSEELGNMREMLVPEVFADPADPEDEFADGSLVRERLAAGLPVLKV